MQKRLNHQRVFLFAILCVCQSYSQEIRPTNSLVLNVDYSRFRYDSVSTYFEVYYSFYPQLVSLHKDNTNWIGAIEISLKLVNSTTGLSVIKERQLLSLTVEDTSKPEYRSMRISQTAYTVPPGEYTFTMLAADTSNRSRRDSISTSVTLFAGHSGAYMSDIEFCSNIEQNAGDEKLFIKNGMKVVPNPSLVFGTSGVPVAFSYLELYNLDVEIEYELKIALRDATEKSVKEVSRKIRPHSKNIVDVGTLNLTSFPSGRYRMEILLEENSGAVISSSKKVLYIYNPHLRSAKSSAVSTNAINFTGYTLDELNEEFSQTIYFSTQEDRTRFSALSNVEAKREFLAQFWLDAEKGIEGRPRIRRTEYLTRVRLANQKFGVMGRPGWKTDRGRVFVLYGQPDDIQLSPSNQESKPYETWSYYQLENGVEFNFIDRSGFGDYVLVHSTKRGELRDEEWRRQLR